MYPTANLLERSKPVAIILASLLMAILFGWISTTANLIIISIAVAMFAGGVLLARPVWIVWIALFMGLLMVGIMPLYYEQLGSKSGWAVSILCFILMFLALFRTITTPDTRKGTPSFIWLLFIFLIYAILNSLVQWYSVEEFVGGFKRYFQMWGLLFSLCWLNFDERNIRRWQFFFLIVALIQVPFAIYENILLVPMREALVNFFPDMVPIDVVGGTFGSSLYGGGNSGEMATFLVIILAFLLARTMQKTLSIGRLIPLTLWILFPLFLGETKAVIIMLPLMFLVVYRRELLAKPHYGLLLLFVCILLMIGMGYAYLNIMEMSLNELLTQTLSYNLYEKGYGASHLNRTTALTFWASQQGAHDPISFVFGNGLGSSHQETRGHLDLRYPHFGIGLTASSTLLWDMGVVGCGLFFAIFVQAWRAAGRLYRESTEPMICADAIAIQAALSLFFFHIFYRLELLENIGIQIVFASVLGYLAWLYRRHAVSFNESSLS
ncbi:MAG: hypothetical protein ACXW00_03920 [Methylobacter sp.]